MPMPLVMAVEMASVGAGAQYQPERGVFIHQTVFKNL